MWHKRSNHRDFWLTDQSIAETIAFLYFSKLNCRRAYSDNTDISEGFNFNYRFCGINRRFNLFFEILALTLVKAVV